VVFLDRREIWHEKATNEYTLLLKMILTFESILNSFLRIQKPTTGNQLNGTLVVGFVIA